MLLTVLAALFSPKEAPTEHDFLECLSGEWKTLSQVGNTLRAKNFRADFLTLQGLAESLKGSQLIDEQCSPTMPRTLEDVVEVRRRPLPWSMSRALPA